MTSKQEYRMARPNLFIVGAPKCGTTAWVDYLGSHPDIYFAEMKEPSYFAFDMPRIRLTRTLGQYERLFNRGRDRKLRGEASALYLCSDTAAQAIAEYDPAAKILIFLRRQEDFLPSLHHQFLYRFTEEIDDFEKVWRMSSDRPPETIPRHCRHPKMLDYAAMGDFETQVERFAAAFPLNQICLVWFDEWTADPRRTYLDILEFLGLEDDGRSDFQPINEAKSYRVKWLGRLVAHPPQWAEFLVGLVRRVTGRSALGIGARASKLIAAPGYRTRIPAALREEIRKHYESSNRRLRSRFPSQREKNQAAG
jgi:hypothetical protein